MTRFVQLRPAALDECCRSHQLTLNERALLTHVLLGADWRTRRYGPFTMTGLVGELGLGPAGRRQVPRRLRRLHELGVIGLSDDGPGMARWVVAIPDYELFVRSGAGSPADHSSDTGARGSREERGRRRAGVARGAGPSARGGRAKRPSAPRARRATKTPNCRSHLRERSP